MWRESRRKLSIAWMPEWSKGEDLRSSVFARVGSNPTSCINRNYTAIIKINFNNQTDFCKFSVPVAQLVRAFVL